VTQAVPFPRQFRSQAFSTSQRFPSTHEFHGISQPQPFLSLLPSERSPRPDRGLSRAHQLPRGHPPTCPNAPIPALSPTVSPTSTRERAVAWFPRRLWAPFRRALARLPVTLGHKRRVVRYRPLHPPRSLAPRTSPFVMTRVTPSHQPLLSWAFAPPETLPDLGSSDPPEPGGSNTRRRPKAPARDLADLEAPEGAPRPPRPGETSAPL